MSNPYQPIVNDLDLKEAVGNLTPNDLIPARPEDKVRGELGARFLEGLKRHMNGGTYDPSPAYLIATPKTDVATRPAALLSLDDRVVLAALVNAIGARIDGYLLGSGLVFWPRGMPVPKRWPDFERSVLSPRSAYVVRGDVTGFYEFVDHDRLADAIISATGHSGIASALNHFLQRVMNSRRGLPQGLLSSDALATLYLADLDFAMIREGFDYFRHGDDVRIGVEKYSDGRRAIEVLEAELRSLGLTLNGSKTRILRRATYEREVSSLQGALGEAHDQVVSETVQALIADPEKLAKAMATSNLDQLAWDFFYHGRIGLNEVIKKLRVTIKPSDTELARAVFMDAVRKRPGRARALQSRLFHQRLNWSLVRLAASRSTAGLEYVGGLLRSFPPEAAVLCSYLSALASTEPQGVVREAEKALHNNYLTEWELVHVVRVLTQMPTHVSTRVLRTLRKILASPHRRWLAAVEIVKAPCGPRRAGTRDAVKGDEHLPCRIESGFGGRRETNGEFGALGEGICRDRQVGSRASRCGEPPSLRVVAFS